MEEVLVKEDMLRRFDEIIDRVREDLVIYCLTGEVDAARGLRRYIVKSRARLVFKLYVIPDSYFMVCTDSESWRGADYTGLDDDKVYKHIKKAIKKVLGDVR